MKKIAIIGGGTAALFLAAFLDVSKYNITIYEKNKTLGRKFLVAGDGGFNLTHSESVSQLRSRYHPNAFMDQALDQFDNQSLISFLIEIEIPTYIGSSNKIYPEKGIKPIQVLKKLENYLLNRGVNFKPNHTFLNWSEDGSLIFNDQRVAKADYYIFALGGASWKVTGSDGTWIETFKQQKIAVNKFQAANCSFGVNWDKKFIAKNEGKPLKNIAAICNNNRQAGELVITKFGLEGNAIYGLSLEIQNQLNQDKEAKLYIDLKPVFSLEKIKEKLENKNMNTSDILRKNIKLNSVQIQLLKTSTTKEEFLNTNILAQRIKNLPINITASGPIDEAISTTGGVALKAIDANYELIAKKDNFCIGEMLDWNAPTGGYLIQACASMGAYLAHHLNKL